MSLIRFMRATCALAALALAAPAAAQGVFNVQVVPTVGTRAGDVLTVSYVVRVLPGSTDSLSIFLVDAPGTSLQVSEPAPSTAWGTRNRFRKRPVAAWMLLEGLTAAGQETPPLQVSGTGVLGIVPWWAEPEHPLPTLDSDVPADTAAAKDTIVDLRATVGTTIGIVQPADRSEAGVAAQLRASIAQACTLGWIDNEGVCNSLAVKARAEAGALRALQQELDAQRGKHVSEPAYMMLADNVQYLLAKL